MAFERHTIPPGSGSGSGSAAGRTSRAPVIAHVDMDAFYVEAELLSRPELKGKKVIVAGQGRSVVLSASYQSRADGVRSAMPLSRALQLSPASVVLSPQMHLYRELSGQIMSYFDSLTAIKEQLSVDEAFLDLTGAGRTLGTPQQMGERIRAEIRSRYGLPASVGIADRKFIAKIASQQAKPDGLLLVPPAERISFLHALPIRALWGVGPKTAEALENMGLRSVEQISQTPRETLQRRFGVTGEHLYDLSWGRDPRAVTPQREEKSIGHEDTFAEDLWSETQLSTELLHLAHKVAARLRAAELTASTVSIKVRFKDFTTVNRSATLVHPTDSAPVLYQQGLRLLRGLGERSQAVRLLGLRAEKLGESQHAVQLSITEAGQHAHEDHWAEVERAVDAVAGKFPSAAVKPATLLRRHDG